MASLYTMPVVRQTLIVRCKSSESTPTHCWGRSSSRFMTEQYYHSTQRILSQASSIHVQSTWSSRSVMQLRAFWIVARDVMVSRFEVAEFMQLGTETKSARSQNLCSTSLVYFELPDQRLSLTATWSRDIYTPRLLLSWSIEDFAVGRELPAVKLSFPSIWGQSRATYKCCRLRFLEIGEAQMYSIQYGPDPCDAASGPMQLERIWNQGVILAITASFGMTICRWCSREARKPAAWFSDFYQLLFWQKSPILFSLQRLTSFRGVLGWIPAPYWSSHKSDVPSFGFQETGVKWVCSPNCWLWSETQKYQHGARNFHWRNWDSKC